VIRANGAVIGALGSAAAGLAGLAFGIRYGLWESGSPLAGFFPALAGAMLLLFGTLSAAHEWRWPAPPDEANPAPQRGRVLGYLAAVFGFAFLLEPLGAMLAIALMFLWLLAAVERLPWRVVLPVTFGATLSAWLLFDRLLQVPLPRGILGGAS
jgi:putative tricarboxylic transport membrane protein